MISTEDIVAMKINAIFGRGTKKDFWDIHLLLAHYRLEDMIRLYHTKYPNQAIALSIPQALLYFNDAEEDEDPICLQGLTWDQVKSEIQDKVRSYLE